MTIPDGSDGSNGPVQPGDAPAPTGVEVIRSQEQLRVGTTWEAVERVRLARRIVTEVRQIDVEVCREELVVERDAITDLPDGSWSEPVGSAAPQPDGAEIVMVLSEEVPMITMRTRPYERVRARVAQVTEERAVTEQVRHEEVVIDKP